jgi:hypothetical protein
MLYYSVDYILQGWQNVLRSRVKIVSKFQIISSRVHEKFEEQNKDFGVFHNYY